MDLATILFLKYCGTCAQIGTIAKIFKAQAERKFVALCRNICSHYTLCSIFLLQSVIEHIYERNKSSKCAQFELDLRPFCSLLCSVIIWSVLRYVELYSVWPESCYADNNSANLKCIILYERKFWFIWNVVNFVDECWPKGIRNCRSILSFRSSVMNKLKSAELVSGRKVWDRIRDPFALIAFYNIYMLYLRSVKT